MTEKLRSMGTAFVELEDKHQIPNALRLHHSMFQGRQINVSGLSVVVETVKSAQRS